MPAEFRSIAVRKRVELEIMLAWRPSKNTPKRPKDISMSGPMYKVVSAIRKAAEVGVPKFNGFDNREELTTLLEAALKELRRKEPGE